MGIFGEMKKVVAGAAGQAKEDIRDAVNELVDENIPPYDDPTLDEVEGDGNVQTSDSATAEDKDTLPGIPPVEDEHEDAVSKPAEPENAEAEAGSFYLFDQEKFQAREVKYGDPEALELASKVLEVIGMPTFEELKAEKADVAKLREDAEELKARLEKERANWAERVRDVGHREEATKKWAAELEKLKTSLDEREAKIAEREKLAEESLAEFAQKAAEKATEPGLDNELKMKGKPEAKPKGKSKAETKSEAEPAESEKKSTLLGALGQTLEEAKKPKSEKSAPNPEPQSGTSGASRDDIPPMPATPPEQLKEIIADGAKENGINSDLPEPAMVFINPRTGRTATYEKYVAAGKPVDWFEEVRWLFPDGSFSSCEVSPKLKETFLGDDELDIRVTSEFFDEAQEALRQYYIERPLMRQR